MKGTHNEGLDFVIISFPNFLILWLLFSTVYFEIPSVCFVLRVTGTKVQFWTCLSVRIQRIGE